MARSKCLAYNDEQLRILLCIAGYGPLSLTDLSIATGIKRGNLSTEIKNLLSHEVLKKDGAPQMKSRRRGRPREYLALRSPWLIQDICDELEYRKYQYESEVRVLNSFINNKFWADWSKIANDSDEGKRQDFLDKYSEIMRERINLGAEDGSFSAKAIWEDIDGQRTLVMQQYDGVQYSTREISYQGIKYWLRRLQSPTLKILGFFMDNVPKEYSEPEIAEGAGLEPDILSRLLPKLEDSQKIVATRIGQAKTYRLDMQNREIVELMDTIGLRKMNLMKT